MSKRRIAVITATRAEYGLLYWIMRELQMADADLKLIVTGAHLSADHGYTINHIKADGFKVDAEVDMRLGSDTPLDLTHAMAIALSGIADALSRLAPDIVIILGDRYEMLAAATAAVMLRIPIAHIHGGEVTLGAIDESIRHAITKLSYWHFASTQYYANRIIQLGEEPSRVFPVGAPGIDNLVRLPLLARGAFEKEMDIVLTSPIILFTYHPETLNQSSAEEQITIVLSALEQFPSATMLITGANADSGGRAINHILKLFAAKRPKTLFRTSFGSLFYLSAMQHCDVVVGNSSSAMIEAPVLGKASVNIGSPQQGRLRTPTIIDCVCTTEAIGAAITKALSPEFQKSLTQSCLFGIPGAVSTAIAKELMEIAIPSKLEKPFYDMP